MKALGITQEYLANKLFIAQPTLCLKIHNKRNISKDEWDAIRSYLEITKEESEKYIV